MRRDRRAVLGGLLGTGLCGLLAAAPAARPDSGVLPSGPIRIEPSPSVSASPPEFGLDLTRLDQTLAEVEGLLADAHFPTAVGVATQGVRSLNEMEPSPAVRARRARLEVLVATAEVALGQRARARASLLRALAAEPQLALDPATTSPKVIAALRAARRAPAPPPPVRGSP